MSSTIGMGRRAIGALVPESFRDVARILGFEIDFATAPVSFSFHRERRDGVWGWATRLHVGRLCIHAPWIDGLPFPRRRVEAERWVVDFCGRIGIKPMRNVEDERIRQKIREDERDAKAKDRRRAFKVIPGGA